MKKKLKQLSESFFLLSFVICSLWPWVFVWLPIDHSPPSLGRFKYKFLNKNTLKPPTFQICIFFISSSFSQKFPEQKNMFLEHCFLDFILIQGQSANLRFSWFSWFYCFLWINLDDTWVHVHFPVPFSMR
jgi:hypothetical protein